MIDWEEDGEGGSSKHMCYSELFWTGFWLPLVISLLGNWFVVVFLGG